MKKQNSKQKILQKKIVQLSRAFIVNSIAMLLLLCCFSLFNFNVVKEMHSIEFIDQLCNNAIIYNCLVFIILFINFLLVFKTSCPKIHSFWVFIITCISMAYKIPMYIYHVTQFNVFADIVYVIVITLIIKGKLKRSVFMLFVTGLIQLAISAIRKFWLTDILTNHISMYMILNIDLFMFIYNVHEEFMRKGEITCGDVSYSGESQVGFTQSQDSFLVSLRSHITSWLESSRTLRKAKKKEKKSKKSIEILDIIYVILYLCWNAFTFWIVYRFARIDNKVFEVSIVVIVFIINKSIFGRPLHLSADACFIVSLLVFYTLSKSIPGSSVSILIPIIIGLSLAMISNIIQETFFIDKSPSLRNRIINKVGNCPTQFAIQSICKKKGWTDSKSEDISFTVFTYLNHSQYETAEIVGCDNRTVTRRINEFLKD